jgi:signal transduction histidine kinase
MNRWPALAISASVAAGLLAATTTTGDDPVPRLADLAVGWTLLGAGIAAWRLRGSPSVAILLAATGATWFLGVYPEALYLHRGPLVHLLVTYPGWRTGGRIDTVAVAVGYVAAVLPWPWADAASAVLLAVALVAVCVRSLDRARASERAARRTALVGSLMVSAAIVLASLSPVLLGPSAVSATLLVYQAAVAAAAVLLVAGLPHVSPVRLTDAVVDLGAQPIGSLRRRLADALADPSVELAFWSPTTRDFRTDQGDVVDPDAPRTGRSVVVVTRSGDPFAALDHDAQSLRDPRLVRAVTRAVRLSDIHAELLTEVGQAYQQVYDSRRRLVVAADDERRALDARLRRGPERLLVELDADLVALDDADGPVRRAREHCREAQVDLHRLSAGLYPRDLDDGGLAQAVRTLAARQPGSGSVTVEGSLLPGVLPAETETTAYYVVAEALANAAKHAPGAAVRLVLRTDPGSVHVVVCDDGPGGATSAEATGLAGLADRVAAMGGSFDVVSPRGGGTTVAAVFPREVAS